MSRAAASVVTTDDVTPLLQNALMAQEPHLPLELVERNTPTALRTRRGRATERPVAITPMTWRLDDRTRQVGRRGVAQAREALRNARRPLADAA